MKAKDIFLAIFLFGIMFSLVGFFLSLDYNERCQALPESTGLFQTPKTVQTDPDNPATQRSMSREEYEEAGGQW